MQIFIQKYWAREAASGDCLFSVYLERLIMIHTPVRANEVIEEKDILTEARAGGTSISDFKVLLFCLNFSIDETERSVYVCTFK